MDDYPLANDHPRDSSIDIIHGQHPQGPNHPISHISINID